MERLSSPLPRPPPPCTFAQPHPSAVPPQKFSVSAHFLQNYIRPFKGPKTDQKESPILKVTPLPGRITTISLMHRQATCIFLLKRDKQFIVRHSSLRRTTNTIVYCKYLARGCPLTVINTWASCSCVATFGPDEGAAAGAAESLCERGPICKNTCVPWSHPLPAVNLTPKT